MTQIQLSDWKRSWLLHLCTCIFVPKCPYVAHWRHLAYPRAQSTSISTAITYVRQLRWLNLSDLCLHDIHLVLVRCAQYATPTVLQFGAQ